MKRFQIGTMICCGLMLFVSGSSNSSFGNPLSLEDPVDRIVLKNGTVIQGRILEEKKEGNRTILVVRMKSGGVVSLDRSRQVDKVRQYDASDAHFERELALAGNDVEALRKLYQWTEQQPNFRSRFKNERQFLLEKIIEQSPDDKEARTRLGYRQLDDGTWVMETVYFNSRGYRKRDGRTWQSNLPSQFQAQLDEVEALKKQRRADVDLWTRRAGKAGTSAQTIEAELRQITDDVTVAVLRDQLQKEEKSGKRSGLRRYYMEAFGNVATIDSVVGLGFLAVQDSDAAIRDRAATLLCQPAFDPEVVASVISGYLTVDTKSHRDRAAYLIGELNATQQITMLISALEREVEVIENPGADRMNFGTGAGGTSFSPPSTPIKGKRKLHSEASRTALKKITGMDYGFDQQEWTRWYIQNWTHYNAQVRTDDEP